MLRCKPGDLCLIVKSGNPAFDGPLAQHLGMPVTATKLIVESTIPAWNYLPNKLRSIVLMMDGLYSVDIYAIPDVCLKPIRGLPAIAIRNVVFSSTPKSAKELEELTS